MTHDDTPRPCCAHLRCKSMFYRDDERPGKLRDDESMGYWCNKTSDSLGPDEVIASHKNCQNSRGCFVEKA